MSYYNAVWELWALIKQRMSFDCPDGEYCFFQNLEKHTVGSTGY